MVVQKRIDVHIITLLDPHMVFSLPHGQTSQHSSSQGQVQILGLFSRSSTFCLCHPEATDNNPKPLSN